MQYQVRYDDGELRFFSSMKEAYCAWKYDPSIWKISYNDGKPHRWVCENDGKSIIWRDEPLLIEIVTIEGMPVASIQPSKETLTDEEFKSRFNLL